MYSPQFDLFVNTVPAISLITETIMMKLFQQLRSRLDAQGFGNVVVDSGYHMSNIDLEASELQLLQQHPFYLSEHYLTQRIVLDPQMTVKNRFEAPWNVRPAMNSYTYAERGKRPTFHAMIVGSVNSGKTYIQNEFKLLLQELVPGIEVIICDNDCHSPDNWDITSDPVYYKEYGDRIRMNGICFGRGPSFNVGFDNQIHHNVKAVA